jgi:Leucine-rich repeat (LRR) protein
MFPCKTLTYVDFSWCEFMRKSPDLSMTPNIKKLNLSYCKNLVEVHDSIGCLVKLEELELNSCTKLQILPSCLRLKSLTSFSLENCPSLKRFPNISQEMTSLYMLNMTSSGFSELPPSFGNLTGLSNLLLGDHLVHLPGSIYKLQHITSLTLDGDIIFPKDMEIDRQPLCNSYGGLSKYVFPSLNRLSLQSFKNRSEIDFILTSCCPLTLEELYIYDSHVTLPESISRFERLHKLDIKIVMSFEKFQGFHKV